MNGIFFEDRCVYFVVLVVLQSSPVVVAPLDRFFGSARAKSRQQYEKAVATASGADLERLKKTEFMVEHYEAVRELTKRFTQWNAQRQGSATPYEQHVVATGGGPGMMEVGGGFWRRWSGGSCWVFRASGGC